MGGLWTDWQFWVVTAVAAGGLFLLIRPLLSRKTPAPGCGHCDGCAAPPSPPPLVKLGAGRRP
jgi:hypothetical protein